MALASIAGDKRYGYGGCELAANGLPVIKPRRPLDDDADGYMESDKDFFGNNYVAAVWLMENVHRLTLLRCAVTGNPCGTDTWAKGRPCPCSDCRMYLGKGADDSQLIVVHEGE